MGRIAFVAWLYIMAAASVIIALGDRSWGWALGAIAFFFFAQYSRRQLKKEVESAEREPPRLNFVAISMIVMIAGILLIFWLTS